MTAREAALWLKSAHSIAELQQMNFYDLPSFLGEVQSGIGRKVLPRECIAFSEHVDTVAITAEQLETGYNFLCRHLRTTLVDFLNISKLFKCTVLGVSSNHDSIITFPHSKFKLTNKRMSTTTGTRNSIEKQATKKHQLVEKNRAKIQKEREKLEREVNHYRTLPTPRTVCIGEPEDLEYGQPGYSDAEDKLVEEAIRRFDEQRKEKLKQAEQQLESFLKEHGLP
jgi:hypothetical protein